MSLNARSLSRIRRGKLVRRVNMHRMEYIGDTAYYPYPSRHARHGQCIYMPRHVMDEFGTLVAAPIENYAWRESSYRERWLLFNLPRMIQDLEAGVVPTVFHGYTGERIPVTSILYRVATKFRGPVFRDNPNDISYYFH